MIWDPNEHSWEFSRCYEDHWVDRLFGGFRRHLKRPFRFVAFTDRPREFNPAIEQAPIMSCGPDGLISYACMTEPYKLNVPMILTGLDTVVVASVDKLADYCMTAKTIALPRDIKDPRQSINGVALVPAGHRYIYEEWVEDGCRASDMEWLRRYPNAWLDEVFPGAVQSIRHGDRNRLGIEAASIIYMHGSARPHLMQKRPLIYENWQV